MKKKLYKILYKTIKEHLLKTFNKNGNKTVKNIV